MARKHCMLIKVIVAIFFFVEISRCKNGIKVAALKKKRLLFAFQFMYGMLVFTKELSLAAR
jgi:hypothetical protein